MTDKTTQPREQADDLQALKAAWGKYCNGADLPLQKAFLFAAGFRAALTQQAAPEAPRDWINNVVRDIAELPDRDSPDGQPDMMLVTVNELHDIIGRHAPVAAPEAPTIIMRYEWHRMDMDDMPDASRKLDVVLDNGVTEYDRGYSLIDWTAVRDWRYADQPAAAPLVPEVAASEQQALRDGYQGSTMVSDFQGPKITLRYATSAQAEAAHAALCKMIDATPAATTASARKEKCAHCKGTGWRIGSVPCPYCRTPAPSRNAAPLDKPSGDQLRAIVRSLSGSTDAPAPQEYVLAGWRAALTQQSAAQAPSPDADAEKLLAHAFSAARVEIAMLASASSDQTYVAALTDACAAIQKLSGAAQASHAGADTEKQAARYCWLRDKSEPGICAFYLSVGQAFKDVKFTKETVDDAIDAQIAAMSAATPGPI